jgi:hypothetical protein
MIETSAPSFANAIATARPIPLSPPVMIATLPLSLPVPLCFASCDLGRGRISDSRPGRRACCWRGWPFPFLSFFSAMLFPVLRCFSITQHKK